VKASKNIETISDEILAEVEQGERVKLAEVAAVREATPRYATEIGQLMHKVAEDLRATPREVTYDDLTAYLGERR
jgi:hypothetical protein